MSERWTPDSWRGRPALQLPEYPDAKALADVEAQLATFPPLVFCRRGPQPEKRRSAAWPLAMPFCCKGATCAESFAEHGANNIRDFLSACLAADGGGVDLCRRAAGGEGSAASPGNSPSRAPREPKSQNGVELPSYRGDIVNGHRVPRRKRASPIRSAS